MFFCFMSIVMYILNVASAIKQMTVNGFIFENYYKKNRFCQRKHLFFNDTFEKKGLLLIATKLIKKIADLLMLRNIIILALREKTQNQ